MPRTVEIRPATIADIRRDGADLLRQHYEELTLDKARDRLDPMWARYEALEGNDALLVLGAYDGDELVGYSVTVIAPHLHYVGTTSATNDVMFLSASHRGGPNGRELISMTERMSAAMGADVITWHAKQGTALERLLPRLGYGVQDIIYSRSLDRVEG